MGLFAASLENHLDESSLVPCFRRGVASFGCAKYVGLALRPIELKIAIDDPRSFKDDCVSQKHLDFSA